MKLSDSQRRTLELVAEHSGTPAPWTAASVRKQTLAKLVEAGFVRAVPTTYSGDRLEVTDAGRKWLARWRKAKETGFTWSDR